MQKNPKIFGIGLSRTGTRTLHEAMLRLGYRSRHYAFDQEIVDYLRKRRRPPELRLHALEEFDALHDVPICALYQPLDRAYPGSKFILTVRDKESWIRSCRLHLEQPKKSRWFPLGVRAYLEQFLPGRRVNRALRTGWSQLVKLAAYGTPYFDEEIFRRRYDEHLAEVQSYFAGREGDLLVLDICAGEAWEKLCPFLGRQIPPEPFPWEHRLATAADLRAKALDDRA